MAYSKNERNPVSEKRFASGFGGIDRRFNGTKNRCRDLRNFRLCTDGTLACREGFAAALSLGDVPRAVWSGNVNCVPTTYALVRGNLLLLEPETGRKTTVGQVASAAGEAGIFWHDGELFVLDGTALYRLSGGTLSPVRGYAPLIGKGWDPVNGGAPEEQINLLSPSVRIRYTVTDAPDRFEFGRRAVSLDRMIINGETAAMEEYATEFTPSARGITVENFPADCEVELCLTLARSELPDAAALLSCTRALSFGDASDRRVCFWNGSEKSQIFFSHPIDADGLARSRAVYRTSVPLYLPVNSAVTVGEGRHPVTALCPHFDRVLLFTSDEAWCVSTSVGKNPEVCLVSASAGCSLTDACGLAGSDPVTVYRGGVLRWHTPAGVKSECTAVPISNPLCDLAAEITDKCRAVLSVPERGEIWFSAPEGEENRIFIFNCTAGEWCTYTGIGADCLFRRGGRIGFLRGENVFFFDPARTTDAEEGQELPIPASLETAYLDFGLPQALKNGVSLLCNSSGGCLPEITLSDDNFDPTDPATAGCTRSFTVPPSGFAGWGDEKAAVGRFRALTVTLRAACEVPFAVRALILRAW